MIQALLALAVALMAGCQTVATHTAPPSTKIITADQWLAQSSMAQANDQPLSANEAASFLRRTGFEPSPDEVAALVGQPRHDAIDMTLVGLSAEAVIADPAWATHEPRYWGNESRTRVENERFRTARDAEAGLMRQWWVQQMIASPSPMAERMVLFWDNTFVVGYSGLGHRSHALWKHHQLIRQHAVGDYRALLAGMVRDPAVLRYLDNNSNTKEAPNENLARELFELYTLGEGNYSEQDIKQAALALTGWGETDRGGTRFELKPWAMAGGSKRILGQRGPFDGDDLPDIILQTPHAARFVATRLYHEFISSQAPPEGAIDDFADASRATGFRIDALLKVMLRSAYFWDPAHQGMGVKSPTEYVVGTVRSTQTNSASLAQLVSAIQAQGQNLLDPPDVSGYDGGIEWLSPEYLIERQRFSEAYQQRWLNPPTERMDDTMTTAGTDTLRVMLGGEAYQGPPEFQVSVKHSAGTWYSETYAVEHARDTERLGRYKDKSAIEYSPVTLAVPADLRDVERISVRFVRDAAGNGGDRNLFVAGVDYRGQQASSTAGVQAPGCRNDQDGAKRRPGFLYCSGELRFDWSRPDAQTTEAAVAIPGALNTREWVLGWMNDENDRWRSINMMFDGLEFQGREWDFFGFQYEISDQGERQLRLSARDCIPDCLVRWPSTAWKDKAGVPSISVPFRAMNEWSMKHYSGLGRDDRELVKALIALAPLTPSLLNRPREDRYPERTTFWLSELDTFAKQSQARRWRRDQDPVLQELGSATDADGGMAMGSMMAAASEPYVPATGLKSSAQWAASAASLGGLDWALATPTPVQSYADVLISSAYYLR
ncbi:MAG: DUF1800 family protein [Litorivicinus sp.]